MKEEAEEQDAEKEVGGREGVEEKEEEVKEEAEEKDAGAWGGGREGEEVRWRESAGRSMAGEGDGEASDCCVGEFWCVLS